MILLCWFMNNNNSGKLRILNMAYVIPRGKVSKRAENRIKGCPVISAADKFDLL